MKIYILRPIENLSPNPWSPWFDKAFGFIVQASSRYAARIVASNDAGDEGADAWLKRETSSCEELLVDDDMTKIIMTDFARA